MFKKRKKKFKKLLTYNRHHVIVLLRLVAGLVLPAHQMIVAMSTLVVVKGSPHSDRYWAVLGEHCLEELIIILRVNVQAAVVVSYTSNDWISSAVLDVVLFLGKKRKPRITQKN